MELMRERERERESENVCERARERESERARERAIKTIWESRPSRPASLRTLIWNCWAPTVGQHCNTISRYYTPIRQHCDTIQGAHRGGFHTIVDGLVLHTEKDTL